MKSTYLTNYYPNFIGFKMPRQIWTTMAEMAKICALIRPKARVINLQCCKMVLESYLSAI